MTDDQARIPLPPQVQETGLVVTVPAVALADAIAPVEVLIQEGLAVVSVPAGGDLTPTDLRGVFGPRLLIGVHDVRDTADAQWAVNQQAAFALTVACPDAAPLLRAAGVPDLPSALTPTEVAEAWRGGASAVQVFPAGVLGNSYAVQLAAMLPDARLVARGIDTAFEVRAWLRAGAVAVQPGDKLMGDATRGGDLGALRGRARPMADAAKEILRGS